jgi:hypothetical protein
MLGTKGLATAFTCAAMALGVVPAVAGAAVLHDQNSGGDGSGFFSQTDTDSSTYSEVADDFTVPPSATWTIRGVDVTGFYDFGAGPISGVNVRIYANSSGLPGTQLFQQLGIVPANGTAGPNFSLALTGAPPLSPGVYWISIQVTGLNYPDQIWDWANRTPQVGNPAAARTSLVPACMGPAWVARASAGCGGLTPPDQMFSLSDTAPGSSQAPGPAPPPAQPTTPSTKKKCKKRKRPRGAEAAKKKCKKKRK